MTFIAWLGGEFFIACFVQNVRMAVSDFCIFIEGDAPAGSRNWKAWAVVKSMWLR